MPPDIDQGRYVQVAPTTPGMAGIWANVHAGDAAAFDGRLDALAATVCKGEPRTLMQRRSDALGALAAGADRPMCTCANPDCPAAGAAPVVIHLLAERATLEADGASPGYLPGFAHPARRDGPRAGPGRPTHAAGRARRPRTRLPPVGGAGPVHPVAPPELPVARLRGPSLRHRPHRALSAGPTHPSKLQAVLPCTPLGENVLQRPRRLDRPPAHGTITVIAPTGHRCRTEPAGAQLFAALGTPTGTPHLPADTGPPDPHRDRAAPTRDRIRNQDRRTRIDRERRARSQINAERTRQHHIRITAAQAADPPPF